MSDFRDATVTSIDPLQIQLDGDNATIPYAPATLVDPLTLTPGDRVRYEVAGDRLIVHGRAGGWTPGAVIYQDFQQRAHTTTLYVPLTFSVAVYPRSIESWGTPLGPTSPLWFTKNSSGVITLGGLGTWGGSYAAGTVVANLPIGYRPGSKQQYPITTNSTRGSLIIDTNGDISVNVTVTSGAYFSIANIMFLEASQEPTWVPLTLTNSWTAVAGFGTPAYGVDAFGDVWLRGKVAHSGTWTDNQLIASLPYLPTNFEHFSASSDAAYGYAAVSPSGGGVVSKGAVAGIALSLAGIVYSPSANDSLWSKAGTVTDPLGSINLYSSWVYYGSNEVPAMRLRSDGLVMLRGLYKSGTLNSYAEALPPGMRPFSPLNIERPSSAAFGQLYVMPGYGNQQSGSASLPVGSVTPQAGSSTWFSMDGVCFQAAG